MRLSPSGNGCFSELIIYCISQSDILNVFPGEMWAVDSHVTELVILSADFTLPIGLVNLWGYLSADSGRFAASRRARHGQSIWDLAALVQDMPPYDPMATAAEAGEELGMKEHP